MNRKKSNEGKNHNLQNNLYFMGFSELLMNVFFEDGLEKKFIKLYWFDYYEINKFQELRECIDLKNLVQMQMVRSQQGNETSDAF